MDFDQTGVGNDGAEELFHSLCEHHDGQRLNLQNIYMNATGIGLKAATSINRFLLSPRCQLESLYLSNNPLDDAGVIALTKDIDQNTTLVRLMLSSVGVTSHGATALFKSLKSHSTLTTLDLSQSYATEDLSSHFNFISDSVGVVEAITNFIFETPNLRLRDLSSTALRYALMNEFITDGILRSASLCALSLSTVVQATDHQTQHDRHRA